MSSFLRNMQRRTLRKREDYTPAPQPTIVTDTGYHTLHPTKGWRYVSIRRLAAQQKMEELLNAKSKGLR